MVINTARPILDLNCQCKSHSQHSVKSPNYTIWAWWILRLSSWNMALMRLPGWLY